MSAYPEPGLTPEEALRRAHAWGQAAASSTGAYRAEAERAAAYWYAQHRELVARQTAALRPVPVPQPVPAPVPQYGTAPVQAPVLTAPAYGTPGANAPTYGAATVGWGPPRRRRRRRGSGVMLGVVLVVAVAAYLVNDVRDASDEGTVLPTEQDGAVPPPTVWEDPSPDAGTSTSGMEARWRSGEYAEPVPEPVPGATQTTPFLPDHSDPTDWVVALNPANEGVRVVFTDDPTLNCGMVHVEEHGSYDDGYAGCFHPSYPQVLFVWWADEADPAAKQVLLAHELSHMIQWWHEFDLMQSAVDSGLAEDEEWTHALETDATCRVLSWGGYSAEAADRTSSPCDIDDWSETWLADRAAELGVVVRDY